MDYLLHHLLTTSSTLFPEKTAVGDEHGEMTYNTLSSRVARLCRMLHDAGLQRGERVAFFLDHCSDQAIAIFATSAAGGVFVPVNAQLFPEQVRHIINDSETSVLLTNRQRLESLAAILPDCPSVREVWCMEDMAGEDAFQRSYPSTEGDLAAILYTSGSTGSPKGVMLSHRNLLAGCWIVSEYLKLSSSDTLLGILPLSFDYGLNQLITMIGNGGTYRFFTFGLPNDIVSALQRHAVTGLAGVPTLWALLARSTLGQVHLPHLRYITNSGGTVPTVVLQTLRHKLPNVEFYLMYGLTEAFRSTYLPPSEFSSRPTSIGRAIPNTEIFVVSESGTLCGPDEPGTLVHRGPTVSMGYWKRPEQTAERFRELSMFFGECAPQERVVYSGDIVTMDRDGYLYFIGRKDAMIKSAGHRISPWEIEEVVFKTELVKEAAAIGLKDDVVGQRIKVLAVPAAEAPSDIRERIARYCTERMPQYMVPSVIELVDQLPKTPTGKVDYPALHQREEKTHA